MKDQMAFLFWESKEKNENILLFNSSPLGELSYWTKRPGMDWLVGPLAHAVRDASGAARGTAITVCECRSLATQVGGWLGLSSGRLAPLPTPTSSRWRPLLVTFST
jgi:hypothetical protein